MIGAQSRVLVVLGLSLSAAAVAAPARADVCARESDGVTADRENVVICDELYSERPFVRPRPDYVNINGVASLSGTLAEAPRGDIRIIDRYGATYAVVKKDGKPAQAADLPASMRMPSNRHLYLIYRFEGKIGTRAIADGKTESTIRLADASPEILLSGPAIDQAALGVWEGTVTKLSTSPAPGHYFDPSALAPIRVRFDRLVKGGKFRVWDGDDRLQDGEVDEIYGHVENLDKDERSLNGTLFPALTALAGLNPFKGLTSVDLKMTRVAGMHAPGDDALGFQYPTAIVPQGRSGMARMKPLTSAGLFQEKPSDEWTTFELFAHGSPDGFRLNLKWMGK